MRIRFVLQGGEKMGKIVVEVKDFSFQYRQTKQKAIDNISFQVEEGSFFALLEQTVRVNQLCVML